jgi:hypothetical protein
MASQARRGIEQRKTRRWVNCLLIREIPFSLAMRLWDTYLAEGVRMKEYLTYVLAAFLLTWSADLKRMDFQVWHSSVKPASPTIHAELLILPCSL